MLVAPLALGAARAPQSLQRLVEKHPLASVSTFVGKNNGVHAHISQGTKTFSSRGFYLTVEKQELLLGKKKIHKANLTENYFHFLQNVWVLFLVWDSAKKN